MATIRKLKSGRFNVPVRRGGNLPVSASFPNRTEAKACATKLEGDINQGKHYGYSGVRTVADAIDAFAKSSGAAIRTADDRDRHLAWWRAQFGDRKLFHFTADVVDQRARTTCGREHRAER